MKNKHLAKLSAVMITMILAVNGSFAMAEDNPEAAEPTVIETTVLLQAEQRNKFHGNDHAAGSWSFFFAILERATAAMSLS